MSAYHSYELDVTDQDCLVEALEEQGFKPVVNEQGQHLEGYQGDKRKQVAQVVIPRKQVGGVSNDIGFAKDENGKYQAVISEFDRSKYNEKWLNKIKQAYAAKKAVKLARAAGMTLAGQRTIKTPTGQKLQFVFNR